MKEKRACFAASVAFLILLGELAIGSSLVRRPSKSEIRGRDARATTSSSEFSAVNGAGGGSRTHNPLAGSGF